MVGKKYFFIIISSAMIIIAAGASAYANDGWVQINGTVLSKDNGTPLCAMVLANGQHTFSCGGNGEYVLEVPLDGNGEITLMSFCAGLSPFSTTLKPEEAINYTITMDIIPAPVMSVTYETMCMGTEKANISGTIQTADGADVCGMVLANGQHMFTCGDDLGKYSLEVPLDANGAITLFGFCAGLDTFSVTFTPDCDNYEFPTGNQSFIVEEGEETDTFFGFRSSSSESNLLPSSVDHSADIPDVKNQGVTGSCTAWSTGYYLKTYQEVIEEGWDKNENAFSPMYLFSMQCKESSSPWSFSLSWKVLNDYGCAKWSTLPFEDFHTAYDDALEVEKYSAVAKSMSDTVKNEATNYRGGEKNQFKGISQVKETLTLEPVLFGINNYNAKLWNPPEEENYLAYDYTNDRAGHAILCVGYDDSKFGTGAFKFVNSWGNDWAINGYSWIKYSDYNNIVMFAMTIKDIPNVKNENEETLPEAPINVSATDEEGPYVDVSWDKVSAAQYYRIFRAKADDSTTYKEIGNSHNTKYRDKDAVPRIIYYYSVVGVNDIGESDHYDTDTDAKPYTDQGAARGNVISRQPRLAWASNDDDKVSSHFKVSDIDENAESMEVFISTTSEGPWLSFGWIEIGDFDLTWGEDSEYIGKKPFVKVVMSNPDGYSKASEPPAQVEKTIVSPVRVAIIQTLTAQPDEATYTMNLSWTTDDGNADLFEIWRWLASEDKGNTWIPVGSSPVSNTNADTREYKDDTALPGKDYYYAVCAVYQGTYSEHKITDTPAKIPMGEPNLRLYDVVYDHGQVSNPVDFGITVWNDGGIVFDDYTISISVYDWETGETYNIFANILSESGIFNASAVADSEQLPLYPGKEHTLWFSVNIPPAYADGHKYIWIVKIDAANEFEEKYEDDNRIVCSKSWWSKETDPIPNLRLDQISYNYEAIGAIASFNITVQYKGKTPLHDYSIAITAYDWEDETTYPVFDTFMASDVAEPNQLPLKSGNQHTLSFSKEMPASFANGHKYSWNIEIDAYHEIDELSEDDNLMQSSKLWWMLSDRLLNFRQAASGLTTEFNTVGASKVSSTRPLSDKAVSSDKRRTRAKETYVGPIRFKKPSFCINRSE